MLYIGSPLPKLGAIDMTSGRCGSDLGRKTSNFCDVQPARLGNGASKLLEVTLGVIGRFPSQSSEARRRDSINVDEGRKRVAQDLQSASFASKTVGLQCCRNRLGLMPTGEQTTLWSGCSTNCLWSAWRCQCRQRAGSLDQVGLLVGELWRDHGEQHVNSTLDHGHLEHDCDSNGKALVGPARVLAAAGLPRIDALTHHCFGERVDGVGHGDTCCVMLDRRAQISIHTSAKSTDRSADVDEKKIHYWTVNSRARAKARCAKNGSIMGPVLVAKRQDRVSEGRRG